MISALMFMGVALACVLLRMHIERRRAPLRDACDATRLSLMAFEREESVFDLFVAAGRTWSFSNAKIEDDFNSYLRQGDIPHYVRRYVREQNLAPPSFQSTLFVGHELPPSANP